MVLKENTKPGGVFFNDATFNSSKKPNKATENTCFLLHVADILMTDLYNTASETFVQDVLKQEWG